MSVTIFGVRYDVFEVDTFPDFPADDVGQCDPKNKRILIRGGAPRGTYEHEELHAVFYACGLNLLLETDIKPREKREELIVSMLTPALMSVVRSEELQQWLRG